MWDLQQTCRLYAVTDRKLMGDLHFYDAIEEALQGGITMLQLREKHLSEAEYIHVAKQVHELTKRYGVPMIVNDLPQVALVSGAEGVHVGQSDAEIEDARALLGEEKIIGATAHNLEEALAAEAAGADYLGVGAAFGSTTKLDARPIDRKEYRRICEAVSIPVVAIGGITADNVEELYGRGLSGVAVIGGIFGTSDVKGAAARMGSLVEPLAMDLV